MLLQRLTSLKLLLHQCPANATKMRSQSVFRWGVFVLLLWASMLPFTTAAINPEPHLRVWQICFFDGFLQPALYMPPPVSGAEASDAQWRCVEEPASAVLSLVAAAVHSYLLVKFIRAASPDYPFYRATCCHSAGWIFTSVAAVLLHIHEDRPHFVHEKLDYYGVFVTLCIGVYLAAAHLIRPVPASALRRAAKSAAFIVCICFISYMQFVHFDYGLHVAICGVLMVALSLLHAVKFFQGKGNHDHVRFFLYGSFVLFLASPCEFFDFRPIFGHLDGHALWHLAAIPVAFLWYEFFRKDAEIHTEVLVKQAL
jgi:hypothetical protein